eukprot:COSAG01_NODE_6866_length_3464_cov_14.077266_5_plen_167_part_00
MTRHHRRRSIRAGSHGRGCWGYSPARRTPAASDVHSPCAAAASTMRISSRVSLLWCDMPAAAAGGVRAALRRRGVPTGSGGSADRASATSWWLRLAQRQLGWEAYAQERRGSERANQRIVLTLVELQQMLSLLSAINVREQMHCFVLCRDSSTVDLAKWPGAFSPP